MAWTPPTSPEDCYELSPFGFGPFPEPGESVDICPPHPVGSGYGGVGFLTPSGVVEGGTPYGLGSYGSRWFGRPIVNISGGYGGDPYGFSAYSGSEVTPPFISSAISLNGFEIEIYFSEEVGATSTLTNPANYTLEPIFGAAPATVLSVAIEKTGTVDYATGVLSVVITHTGTTLGGQYKAHATNILDLAGNVIMDSVAAFLAEGEPPAVAVTLPTPDTGDALVVNFSQPMLRAADEPGSGPGIEDAASYEAEPSTTYPIDLTTLSAVHQVDPTQVLLAVKGQTSLLYTMTVGPAFAFAYDLTNGLRNATRVDTGTGTVTEGADYLLLRREKNLAFGLEWQDTSGSITPSTSTIRLDCNFDFASAVFQPALTFFASPEVADIVMQDGPPGTGLLVRFTLQMDATGAEQVRVQSGTFDVVVDVDWSDQEHQISFVRNMKAGIVTFLLDEHPLTSTLTVNADGTPETQAGVRFSLLSGGWDVSSVHLRSVYCSSSLTVFSEAWNFVHDAVTDFTGSALITKDTLLTKRGPIVKGWGDATPGTKQDVTVRVNGIAVDVAEVNPYIGEVRVEVPIPLLPPGDAQSGVAVDYKWFKNPVMEMAGLNTPGLVLNKYDCAHGHHDPAYHGDQVQVLPGTNFLADPGEPKGAVDTSRFPMTVVLGPLDRQVPLLIGHRYLGYERSYSALMNSPTTLLLNQAPGRSSVPGFERTVEGISVAYEGVVKPPAASPAWAQIGSDFGGVDHAAGSGLDLGTYTVIDARVGSYDPDKLSSVVYARGVDLSFPSSVNIVGRVQLTEGALFDQSHPISGTPDVTTSHSEGVFTGVGFGIHDNSRLYLCGLLRINDVEHVGLLLDPKRLHEWSAWTIGPQATLTADSQTSGSFATSQVPMGFEVGGVFQVLTGTQVGVYTTTAVTAQTDGTTTVEFTPELPVPWDLYGNKYPVVVFETRATEKSFTYRFDIDTEQQVAELRFSGETGGVVASIDGNVPRLPAPASTSLVLQTELVGQAFWGSISRQAASRSTWSFVRYAVIPDQVFQQGHKIVINTEMSDLPEDNPASGGGTWFPNGGIGQAYIADNQDTLVLKNTSESDATDLHFGYSRIEPFLVPDSLLDLQAKVRMDSGTLGIGDFELRQDDTQRLTLLRSILYIEDGTSQTTYRRLLRLPVVSHQGFMLPETMDWSPEVGTTLEVAIEGAQTVTTQDTTHRGGWTKNLSWSGSNMPKTDEGRIIEATLEMVAVTPNAAGDTGILIGAQMVSVGAGYALVQMEITPTEVRLRAATGAAVATYLHTATGVHTYRVLCDRNADTASLLIDDVLQGTATLSSFDGGGTNNVACFFGSYGKDIANVADDMIAAEIEWHHTNIQVLVPAAAKRTIGVLKGTKTGTINPFDLDNYEIPRTDASSSPNTWLTGPVIEEMDWREDIEIRVYRDPSWGVTVYRPDLPLPPYYQPEDGTAGSGFITDSVEPSAGWINVEYANLPRSSSEGSLGSVGFGCFDSRSVSQTWWTWVRYRLFKQPSDDLIAPEHMVLNQFNIITSGELTQDVTLETLAIQTIDTRRLTLLPSHMFADSVYKVIDGTTVWTDEAWTFNKEAQLLTLGVDTDTGLEREFSSEHATVTVVFQAGTPVTNTYLENQPFMDGVTLLNEGTPPVPKSQTAESEIEVVYGSGLNDPYDVLNDPESFVLNDPERILRHTDVEGSLYESLEFIEVTNDGVEGLLTSICEGGPGQGFSGFTDAEGEDIYSKTGTGASLGGTGGVADLFATGDLVGRAVGAEVFAFSGTMMTDSFPTPVQADFTQKGGLPGGILLASGGNFLNPTVDSSGNIIPGGFVAGGGTLGPGSAVLYPNFPSKGPVGGDQGRIYQRTDWFMRFSAVLIGGVEHVLAEDFSSTITDEDAPSGVTDAEGAASLLLQTAGDYSRFGPWGGLDSLTPAKDSGTFLLVGLVEGSTVALWDRVGSSWTTFTARAVPLAATDFLLSPNPHTTLAAAITVVIGDQYLATAGLDMSGTLQVHIEAVVPVTAADPAYIISGASAEVRLVNVIPYPDSSGLLIGGAGIAQSSLVAGGTQTLNIFDIHTDALGMIAQGGSVLPAGEEISLTLSPA